MKIWKLNAFITALLLQKTIFRKHDVPFVMELPPYRMPTLRTMVRHMWHRTEQYLKKITSVILIASVIIWALGYFPLHKELSIDYEARVAELEASIADSGNEYVKNTVNSGYIPSNYSEQENVLDEIESVNAMHRAELQERSYIGILGKAINPIMEPLGFDWKMSVALLTGIMAKEVIVGTMGVLYEAGESDEGTSASLIVKLQNHRHLTGPMAGEPVITPLIAFAFMMFILIYFPCVGVVAAIRKETGTWKWPIFSVLYTTTLAWVIAFLVYQVGSLLQ